ncbi:MAG: SDR family oxidoreductase, partial [Spirochaetales bacterium]
MHGRTVLITGATSGIGLETAREIARREATVLMGCRNLQKASVVRDELVSQTGNADIRVLPVDLAPLASVRAFAGVLEKEIPQLDVLVNNAGAFSMTRETTSDGFELTMGTNHLGPFLLTHLLVPLLARGSNARVVNVASDAYKYGRIRFDDFDMDRRYGGFRAYAASRLATVLFTQDLADLLRSRTITANSCHPGHVNTNIWPQTSGLIRVAMKISSRFRITAAEGAAPSIHLACSPEVADVTGTYFDRLNPVELEPRFTDPALR